ncbi:MAG TPA: ISL3 family transposase [Gemmatimonadaceae bacterium]|nr:ISL3 family transposase [Gemmatimonadaceae bacterium]
MPDPEELAVDEIVLTADGAIITVGSCAAGARCPRCGRRVKHMHSRYHRTIADLPWQGMPVTLKLTTRKFFCHWKTCSQRVFTERLPGTVRHYGRHTVRAAAIVEALGLAVGARPGARLAQALGLIATADIILRSLRKRHLLTPRTPRVLGVDDWAWKKRRTYGTLLCDLETGHIVDLLPDRRGETLATWLTYHPGIEFISRDRGGEYAVAAARAAPQAIQIADRFHLLMNLTDAMTRVLTPHMAARRSAYRRACELVPEVGIKKSATRANSCRKKGDKQRTRAIPPATLKQWQAQHHPPWPHQIRREACRQFRRERFERAHALRADKHPMTAIARELGVCRRTIRRWLASSRVPDWSVRSELPRVAPRTQRFTASLRARVAQGCLNATTLFGEIKDMGYTGCYQAVRRAVAPMRPAPGKRVLPPSRRFPPSPQETTWLLRADQGPNKAPLAPLDTQFVQLLRAEVCEINHADALRERFEVMLKERDYNALRPWLAAAELTGLKGFADGIRKDFDAVLAALCFPWSQGATEGHVNRLKAVKRTMYGRGSFELLRHRVLHYAA